MAPEPQFMNSGQAYRFTAGQRKGLIVLCGLIVCVQLAWFFIARQDASVEEKSAEEKEWLASQPEIDALKAKQATKEGYKIYPFNPNYITDYKGYALGMSLEQIDKLKAFRNSGKWVNSAADFKAITGVNDSLLAVLSPYFKFPDWVKNKKQFSEKEAYVYAQNDNKAIFSKKENAKVPVQLIDINTALEEDLIAVRGIGPAFAKKLLRRRSDLGAFVSMDQMEDFAEFSPEAVAGLKKAFKSGEGAGVNKINVNSASLQQLSRFPYFNRDIAKSIITQRSMKGKIHDFDELSKINDIFILKSKIIALYLEY